MASGIWLRIMKMKILLGIAFLALIAIASASAAEQNVCCEKTKTGLYCQNVPAEQCNADSRQVQTSCESTSYCKPGTCYDSSEGTCLDNTPQIVCNANNGVWSEKRPAQCQLGCCVLGDQAAFVSLVRCKRLSGFLGLQTNYKKEITNEVACILSVQNQDKGACVFDKDFEKDCRLTTRADCTASFKDKGEFFKGKLCSAEELGTKCGPTKRTMCVHGKDGVYFVDSCGNPANIYDANKVNDKEYWGNVKDIAESCNPKSANANSASCGNCNYLQGSFCRAVSKETSKATYGDNICQDLNCKKTANGKAYKHGESWCIYDDKGTKTEGNNAVGSRFYKHICNNGEEILEQCADFRMEECIEDKIETTAGAFSQAACRVNRWQDCTAQTEKKDCENSDRRDCLWKEGGDVVLRAGNESVAATGACVPKVTPGLKFWAGEETKSVCAQANRKCVVSFEKGLFGGESCKENCECLDAGWEKRQTEICMSLGDCGPKINWVGQLGYKEGFKKTIA